MGIGVKPWVIINALTVERKATEYLSAPKEKDSRTRKRKRVLGRRPTCRWWNRTMTLIKNDDAQELP